MHEHTHILTNTQPHTDKHTYPLTNMQTHTDKHTYTSMWQVPGLGGEQDAVGAAFFADDEPGCVHAHVHV